MLLWEFHTVYSVPSVDSVPYPYSLCETLLELRWDPDGNVPPCSRSDSPSGLWGSSLVKNQRYNTNTVKLLDLILGLGKLTKSKQKNFSLVVWTTCSHQFFSWTYNSLLQFFFSKKNEPTSGKEGGNRGKLITFYRIRFLSLLLFTHFITVSSNNGPFCVSLSHLNKAITVSDTKG